MKKQFLSFVLASAIIPSVGFADTKWYDNVKLGGAVEFDFVHTDDGSKKASNFDLSTVDIVVDGKVNPNVLFNATLTKDGDNFVFDEGTLTFEDSKLPFNIVVGKATAPFGSYETNVLSDPLTLSLGETTGKNLVSLQVNKGVFSGTLTIFNGDVNEVSATDDNVDNFTATIGYAIGGEAVKTNVVFGYTNNILESDTLKTYDENGDGITGDYKNYVAGYSAAVKLEVGKVTFLGEYVSAGDDIKTTSGTNLKQPNAYHVELASSINSANVAISYSGSKDASTFLPEKLLAVAASKEIYSATTVSVEYAKATPYGNGDDATQITARVAYSF